MGHSANERDTVECMKLRLEMRDKISKMVLTKLLYLHIISIYR